MANAIVNHIGTPAEPKDDPKAPISPTTPAARSEKQLQIDSLVAAGLVKPVPIDGTTKRVVDHGNGCVTEYL